MRGDSRVRLHQAGSLLRRGGRLQSLKCRRICFFDPLLGLIKVLTGERFIGRIHLTETFCADLSATFCTQNLHAHRFQRRGVRGLGEGPLPLRLTDQLG